MKEVFIDIHDRVTQWREGDRRGSDPATAHDQMLRIAMALNKVFDKVPPGDFVVHFIDHRVPNAGCECGDPGCPHHRGRPFCWDVGNHKLRRVDMDGGPLNFCTNCADDALSSGLFAPKEDER